MKEKIRILWERTKVIAIVFFAMAAGVAAHHQYIVQTQTSPQNISEPILIYRREAQSGMTQQEQKIEKLPPNEPEEEDTVDELELLAICVEAEAGNQGLTGKRMVADVILNRVDDPDFPDSIEGVISQPYQFSSFWDGGMDRVLEPSEETIKAVQMELEERGCPGLFYFTAETWPEYGTPWKQVGDHYFNTK